jgi:hypothetical protein
MGSSTNTSTPYPIVTTNAATSVVSTTATLNGTAYNYNSAGMSYFNYGTTSAYGTQTSQVSFTANTITTSFSIGLTGLTAGTTYHFQACVSNSAGITCGLDLTFGTVGTGALTRIGILTSPFTGSGQASKLIIDQTNGFLYACTTDNAPGASSVKLWKVRLSDFSNQGSLLLRSLNGGTCNDMIINSGGTALYIGITTGFISSGNPTLYKVSTSSFSILISVDMGTAGYTNCDSAAQDGNIQGIAVDNSDNVYVGAANTSDVGTICKFNSSLVYQSVYTETGLSMSSSSIGYDSVNDTLYAWDLVSSTIRIHKFNTALTKLNTYTPGSTNVVNRRPAFDYTNSFVYFGTGDLTVAKVNLSAFSGSLITTLTGSSSTAIDSSLGYLYYCANTSPGTIRSQRLTTNVNTSVLTLNSGENGCVNLAIDTTNHFAYIALSVSPTKIVKVQLN